MGFHLVRQPFSPFYSDNHCLVLPGGNGQRSPAFKRPAFLMIDAKSGQHSMAVWRFVSIARGG